VADDSVILVSQFFGYWMLCGAFGDSRQGAGGDYHEFRIVQAGNDS
jgi:hypothetical protein